LSLDLENIKGKEDDLTDTDQARDIRIDIQAGPKITDLPANECIIAFPVFLPNVLSNVVPWFFAR
jgi:hypothetical protein